MQIVNAKLWESMNMSWNLNLFSGPTGIMTCGNCSIRDSYKLPLVNYPVITCKHCGTSNRINIVYQ